MSREPLSLEKIAAELVERVDRQAVSARDQHTAKLSSRKKFVTQFGQVVESFMRLGEMKRVSEETGISIYVLRTHFFSNPEFISLFKASNEQIFLQATQEIRERQENFLKRAANLAEEALDKMEYLLHESGNEHLQFKAAQDLLDRDPRLSRTKRVEGSGVAFKVDVKVLQLAAQAAREIDSSSKE